MPDIATAIHFAQQDLHQWLDAASPQEVDLVDFGVIGFDREGIVRRYNAFESRAAGLSLDRVVGHHLFDVVAPCMNNFLVAQRFEDSAARGSALDEVIDYVLTLRMRPTRVKLRLLSVPTGSLRYVLVQRQV
jgi:photoactive yellow protein